MLSILLLLAFMLPPQRHGSKDNPADAPPPVVPYPTPKAGYPLELRILSAARQTTTRLGMTTDTTGSAKLLTAPKTAFDYKTDCPDGLSQNIKMGEFYQGKWKKQDRQIEILVEKPGKTHSESCWVDVTVKPAAAPADTPSADANQ